jgi:hypothetical protein
MERFEISEEKIAVCVKTAGLQCGKFSDLNSACSKVLVPIKIFQFQDMLNKNSFLATFQGHSKRPSITLAPHNGSWFYRVSKKGNPNLVCHCALIGRCI